MPLSRANRSDRRRRVMLDAIVNDADLAVETVRAKKRTRSRDVNDSEEDAHYSSYKDPGYSQAVRRTCQTRLVQLIPVRRGTVAVVLTLMWIAFAILLFAHYWIYVRGEMDSILSSQNGVVNRTTSVPSTSAPAPKWSAYPISQLFHLRSTHGIGHWLTSQLWLLTGIASWMIFNLRKHKLDDYRARYRVWVVVAAAAVLLGFDASTSSLLLVGMSIDPWARAEIGYGGVALILAMVASLLGVLSIRLSTELKAVPSSVASWIFGLVACGISALLGTGLLRVQWQLPYLELLVGGLWLGGILAVFQSTAMYLRFTYIGAQKRFLLRNGVELGPMQLKMPKLKMPRIASRFRRGPDVENDLSGEESERVVQLKSTKSRSSLSVSERDDRGEEERYRDDHNHKSNRNNAENESNPRQWKMPWSRKVNRKVDVTDRDEGISDVNTSGAAGKRGRTDSNSADKQKAHRLFGVIPNRQLRNEQLEHEPVREDREMPDETGLTKKQGWFGIGGNKVTESSSKADDAEIASKERRKWFSKRKGNEVDDSRNTKSTRSMSEQDDRAENRQKRNWLPKLKRSPRGEVKEGESRTESGKKRGALLSLRGRKSESSGEVVAQGEVAENKEKRSWRGMLDGFKLKPPAADSSPSKPDSTTKSNSSKPIPVKPNTSLPTTESEDDDDGRPLSKAERKRLRRQQDDRRIA